mgnify:CR=1 FL=1
MLHNLSIGVWRDRLAQWFPDREFFMRSQGQVRFIRLSARLQIRLALGVLAAALRLERGEEKRLLAEAARQIERVGLAEHMFDAAGSLALGQQRIVEIARALASDPCLLLLDEPAAGLRYKEKQALAELLRKLRAEGMGILLVEHDMDFVNQIAQGGKVTVLCEGSVLAEGTMQQVQSDQRVIEVYLGR